MKNIKHITASLVLLFLAGLLSAQQYKISIENPKESKLSLSDFSGELIIEGYSGNEVLIESSDPEKVTVPERAKGLKPVYATGTDNTGIGLSVEKNGNQITINCLLPFTQNGEYTLKVPEEIAIQVKSQCQNHNNIVIQKMKNEIEVQNCASISLKNVSGPLVLSTISGDIDITFGTLATGKPFSINSISGEIDITLPSKLAADIEMGSITGTMYSDFDFSDKSEDIKQVGGNKLDFKLNGGGSKFTIVTVSGNIYLRKGI